MIKKEAILLFLFLLLINAPGLMAQGEVDIISGTKYGIIDTLGTEQGEKITKASKGLLEKEIDPEKYMLGPNDEFTVAILIAEPISYRVSVTPEGSLIIPLVGAVNVKEMKLAEAKKKIIEKIKSFYRNAEVNVSLSDIRQFKVTVSGMIRRNSMVAATAADRVSEIIEKAGGFLPEASKRKILLVRDSQEEPIRVDIVKYYFSNVKSANPTVLGGDHIIVPAFDEENTVHIYGDVAKPTFVEYVSGDSLKNIIDYGLGFLNSANLDSVEIARFNDEGISIRKLYDLSSWGYDYRSKKNLKNNIPINPGYRIFIRSKSGLPEEQVAVVKGEVKYPGYYALRKNEDRLYDLIKFSGGFNENAAIESSRLIRTDNITKEDAEMERLEKMTYYEMSEEERQYYQARKREKKGYISVNLLNVMRDTSHPDNIYLTDGDSLFVPRKNYFINVQGRVNKPGLILYNPSLTYLDYIELAGGFGYRADEDQTLVVKPRGEQFSADSDNYTLEPGDNILVPPEPETPWMEYLTIGLTALSQILAIIALVTSLQR